MVWCPLSVHASGFSFQVVCSVLFRMIRKYRDSRVTDAETVFVLDGSVLECFITSSEGGGLSTEDHHVKCAWELWSPHYSMSRVYVLVGTLGRSCVFLKHL